MALILQAAQQFGQARILIVLVKGEVTGFSPIGGCKTISELRDDSMMAIKDDTVPPNG